MPAEPLLLHQVERRLWRPVASKADLYEVPPVDGPRLDEPAHRRAVTREDAERVRRRISVGVEMDDPDAPRPAHLGDGRCGRPRDRMVAAEDDRDRAGLGDLSDLA